MANRSIMEIVTVFDGEQDAMQVFVDLIARKKRVSKQQDTIAKQQEPEYNEDVDHHIESASGLCG